MVHIEAANHPDPTQPHDIPATGQVMEKLTTMLESSGVNPRDLMTLCHLMFGRGYGELYDRQAWTLLRLLWPSNGSQNLMRAAITRYVDMLSMPMPGES